MVLGKGRVVPLGFPSKIKENIGLLIIKCSGINEVFTLPGMFHMEWVDSNPIPWTGPCGFHGISDKFELQIHVLYHTYIKIVPTSRIECSA